MHLSFIYFFRSLLTILTVSNTRIQTSTLTHNTFSNTLPIHSTPLSQRFAFYSPFRTINDSSSNTKEESEKYRPIHISSLMARSLSPSKQDQVSTSAVTLFAQQRTRDHTHNISRRKNIAISSMAAAAGASRAPNSILTLRHTRAVQTEANAPETRLFRMFAFAPVCFLKFSSFYNSIDT